MSFNAFIDTYRMFGTAAELVLKIHPMHFYTYLSPN